MRNTAKIIARCLYLEMVIESYRIPNYAAIAAELGVSVDSLINEVNKEFIKECQNDRSNIEA